MISPQLRCKIYRIAALIELAQPYVALKNNLLRTQLLLHAERLMHVMHYQRTLRLVGFLMMSIIGLSSFAQPLLPGPSLRCVDVDATGQSTLTWIPIADPGGDFVAYEV